MHFKTPISQEMSKGDSETGKDDSGHRIPKDEWFMKMATLVSERSTCARMQTGCVIVHDNRVISIGYNGTACNQEHCVDHWKEKWSKDEASKSWKEYLNSDRFATEHHEWSVANECHGEHNAILWAAKHGTPLKGTHMYSLFSPCVQCAKAIAMSGISCVTYKYPYQRDLEGLDFLKRTGVEVQNLTK